MSARFRQVKDKETRKALARFIWRERAFARAAKAHMAAVGKAASEMYDRDLLDFLLKRK